MFELERIGVVGRLTLGVVPHELGPAVVDEVRLGVLTGDRLGEVLQAFLLPPRFEAGEPRLVGGAVVADAHC